MRGGVGVYGSPSRASVEMTVRMAPGLGSSMASSIWGLWTGTCWGYSTLGLNPTCSSGVVESSA